MNLIVFLFVFNTLGVNCAIRNGTTTLNNLLSLIWQEGTILIDFDNNRKALENLKKTYTGENGDVSEELFENEQYKSLINDKKRMEAEIPEIQNNISKLVDEFIDLSIHNTEELKRMREELIINSRKSRVRARTKMQKKWNKHNKRRLALGLTVIEEKERYTTLDLDMIQVIKNQTEVQGSFVRSYFKGDIEALEPFRQMVYSLRNGLQGIYRNRLNERPRELRTSRQVPFWYNLCLDDLRKVNDRKEIRVRLLQAIDYRVMRLIQV
ncbi:hypothetical protein MACJ_000506 [Theileria orientalis]|uniref:Uncharacterized protein n=1 Tax=Theileria orientalis TaxID=68886 RepID=A0A976M454_THEOR|nr:hypothetical protein MACJ_000506 [Theileria orientalis]